MPVYEPPRRCMGVVAKVLASWVKEGQNGKEGRIMNISLPSNPLEGEDPSEDGLSSDICEPILAPWAAMVPVDWSSGGRSAGRKVGEVGEAGTALGLRIQRCRATCFRDRRFSASTTSMWRINCSHSGIKLFVNYIQWNKTQKRKILGCDHWHYN